MTRYFRYTDPVARSRATGLVSDVYDQIVSDFGLVAEPFSLHAPSPPILAGQWAILRETLVAGQRPRGEKETIAAAVSAGNNCPWCHDAHVTMLHATGHFGSEDPALAALAAWANRSGQRGQIGTAPFAAVDGPELIGTALTFHYLTRMATVFLAERILPTHPLLKGAMQRIGGLLFARKARRACQPGASGYLLPVAHLPADLSWMASNPTVALAFAQMARAVDEEAAPYLSAASRTLLSENLGAWDGTPPPLSARWTEPLLTSLAPRDRDGARIALLVALAPHQVGASAVRAFQERHPDERALIAVAAYASFTAARQIGTWLTAEIGFTAPR